LELNKVHKIDCFKGLAKLEKRSVDMIFCDLPYGVTDHGWDVQLDLKKIWFYFKKIIKDNGAILLFASNPFDKVLAMSKPTLYRYDWVWEKSRATNHLNSAHMPLRAHENILVFYKKRPTYNPQLEGGNKPLKAYYTRHGGKTYRKIKPYKNEPSEAVKGVNVGSTDRFPRSVLYYQSMKSIEYRHPSEKPIALCEYLIKTYTNPGDLVLDICTGSGSIPLAAKNTGRQFLGFEKDGYFVNIANERLESGN
jgi:DNA modification methylase